jgi:uncharacterized protein YyaL (SSP411 family)
VRTNDPTRQPNHLIDETSPYLLQHAYNPVNWYPWGPTALNKAKQEHKPIFLSIGYSACHWCHVMEEESFSNPEIAALLNANFISIKVDREERPDLDHIYQECAQLLTEQGGWPLSVFLTPDLRPFYIGTYFPPDDRYGRPGFQRVLTSLIELYQKDAETVQSVGEDIIGALVHKHQQHTHSDNEVPEADLVDEARRFLLQVFDRRYGGFGSAPKFPCTANLQLLLPNRNESVGDSHCDAVLFTLNSMAAGGIYDQVGGGFHRYSTDAKWLVPHFEKMLYDNALLPPLYLAAYQLTGEQRYAKVVEETLDYVIREMTHAEGGFFSAQDADSEGEEGKYYAWRPIELAAVLSEDDLRLCVDHYGVTMEGNFTAGSSVLHQAKSYTRLAEEAHVSESEIIARIQRINQQLLAARNRRVPPLRDEKILTGWNGMMISSFAMASAVLHRPEYLTVATRALEFIWTRLRTDSGELLHSWKDRPGQQHGFLEDYIYLCQALLDMYMATFNPVYLKQAQELMQQCIALLWDPEAGGFYMSPSGEDLLYRPKDRLDQSIPSANGVAAQVLIRLHSLAPQAGYLEKVETMLRNNSSDMRQNPWGMASLLKGLDMYHQGITEVVVVTPEDLDDAQTRNLLDLIRAHYLYGAMVYAQVSNATDTVAEPAPCAGKEPVDGKATVYICRNFTCSAPMTTPDKLATALKAL